MYNFILVNGIVFIIFYPSKHLIQANDVFLYLLPAVGDESKSLIFLIAEQFAVVLVRLVSVKNVLLPEIVSLFFGYFLHIL